MRENRWLWIFSFINIAIASIVILGIGATLFALRAFTAYIRAWPLGIFVFIGFITSLIGIQIARGTSLRVPRGIGLIVNGSTLTFYSIIVLGVAATLIAIPRQRYLIPEGYMGDVYVIHGVGDGEPERGTFREITYRIPQDGILRTRTPIIHSLTTTAYYYARADGTLERIRHEWYTTISRTPENLANDKDIGVFFPRTGKYRSNDQKCSVEFLQFYVGTKAYLLLKNQPIDLVRYLNEHPISCSSATN